MQNHPDFIIHTLIANLQTHTHQQAGIVCFFCHFCSNIYHAYVTTYAVIIETTTLKVVGTYIPPSAPIKVFEATFNAYPDIYFSLVTSMSSLASLEMKHFRALWTDSELFLAFAPTETSVMSALMRTTLQSFTVCLQECLCTATLSLVFPLLTLVIPFFSLKQLVLPCQPQYLALNACDTTSGALSTLAPALYSENTLKLLL
ncbi:hypothetical protein DSO57_1009781 [Entomophthora muscae]|uniref:Uncharacterized protein n=1 Tax=Entomophthora muscae TaxID=34485 RepID=A0ACC2S8K9_9FUNG|nr:hypothetical protein DSO57_1009781 [Entomophthora muscae]